MSILVINAGSSTIKISYFLRKSCHLKEKTSFSVSLGTKIWTLTIDNSRKSKIPFSNQSAMIENLLRKIKNKVEHDDVFAIGHRVVHGGNTFKSSVALNSKNLLQIRQLSKLAPLHNQIESNCIAISKKIWPKAHQYACFDTTFFRELPQYIQKYPLSKKSHFPEIKKYGFHGLSHQSVFKQLQGKLKGKTKKEKIISCHLGGGCSISAMYRDRCVDTTMGFTPLDGAMMGTRSGSIDPGIIFYLARQKKRSILEIESELYHESGLLGVSEQTSNIELLIKNRKKNSKSMLAIDMFVSSIAKKIAEQATSINGITQLIFTGGIGEHSGFIRKAVIEKLSFHKLFVSNSKNERLKIYGLISTPSSSAKIWVLPSKENHEIALQSKELFQL